MTVYNHKNTLENKRNLNNSLTKSNSNEKEKKVKKKFENLQIKNEVCTSLEPVKRLINTSEKFYKEREEEFADIKENKNKNYSS